MAPHVADARVGRPAAAVPRAPVQLVRHAHARAAAAAVRLDRRQRQPRRPPAHARRRAERDGRPADLPPGRVLRAGARRWTSLSDEARGAAARTRRSPAAAAAPAGRVREAGPASANTSRSAPRHARPASCLLLQRLTGGRRRPRRARPKRGRTAKCGGGRARSRTSAGYALEELTHLAPWVELPPPPEPMWRHGRCRAGRAARANCANCCAGSTTCPTLADVARLELTLLPTVDALLARRRRRPPCRRRARLARPAADGARAGGRAGGAPAGRAAAARRALHRAGRHRLRVPVRPRPPPARDRLQRRRPPARRQLLRPARLRGAPRQLRRHRPGKAPAGALVQPRPAADHLRRPARAAVVERVDVRVPDAAAGHADLRPHAARRDVPRRRRAADRVRPRARRAVGRLRVRVQQDRRAAQLPVPRVRRPGPRLQARAGRRRGHRAVRQRDGADGRPGVVVREPAPARRGGAARRVRLLRGDRLHARAAAARAGERHRPLVHGAPPGDGVPVAGVPAARPADAAAVRVRPGVPGDRPAAPGARAARRPASIPHPAEVSAARGTPAEAEANYRVFTTPQHARARRCTCSPTAGTTWRSPRRAAGTAAGATWRSRAGTRTRPATAGARSATSATSRRGEFWSTAHQPTLKPATSYEAIYSQGRAEFRRRDGDIETHVEISVSPEDDIELRRVSVTNRGTDAADDRADELRRGRAGAAGGRRGAPGVQQPVRADGARPRRGRRSSAPAGRAPAASGRRG